MKRPAGIKFITAGTLIRELKKFEEEFSDSNVVCSLPDGRMFGVIDTKLDKDGDVRLTLEEIEEDVDTFIKTAELLLFELESYDNKAKVYMAAEGLYLNFVVDQDGSMFAPADDDDNLECDCAIFGEYEESNDEYEPKPANDKPQGETKKVNEVTKHKSKAISAALVILVALLAYGLYYNAAAVVNHTGSSTVENIIAGIVCLVLLIISVISLFSSKKK